MPLGGSIMAHEHPIGFQLADSLRDGSIHNILASHFVTHVLWVIASAWRIPVFKLTTPIFTSPPRSYLVYHVKLGELSQHEAEKTASSTQ